MCNSWQFTVLAFLSHISVAKFALDNEQCCFDQDLVFYIFCTE